MTASTRALRRLTLQFVAGGILDETEVQAQSALSAPSAASLAEPAGSLAVIPPPQVAPSEAPGKDITVPRELPAPVADMGEHIAKVYADGAKALADMQPAKIMTLVPEPVQPERIQTTTFPPDAAKQPDIKSDTFDAGGPPNIHQNPLNQGVSLQDAVQNIPQTSDIKADTELPKRRGRRPGSRNRVNIQSPGQQTEIPPGQIDASGNITPAQPTISVPPATANDTERGVNGNGDKKAPALAETKTEYHVPLPPHVGTTVVIVPDPALQNVMQPVKVDMVPAVVPALPKEKQEEYRTRLSKYYNDILPKGGMSSSEGIGGPTMKTRKFAAIHTGVADTKLMTEQHWNDLFEFLDANATNPKFLVEYINKALGVA